MVGINISEVANGALQERFAQDLQKVLENIYDANTKATVKRKLTITLTFEANDGRDRVDVDIQSKTTLAPIKSVDARFYIEKDIKTKKISAYELKNGSMPNQMVLEDMEEETESAENAKNIINFKSN